MVTEDHGTELGQVGAREFGFGSALVSYNLGATRCEDVRRFSVMMKVVT